MWLWSRILIGRNHIWGDIWEEGTFKIQTFSLYRSCISQLLIVLLYARHCVRCWEEGWIKCGLCPQRNNSDYSCHRSNCPFSWCINTLIRIFKQLFSQSVRVIKVEIKSDQAPHKCDGMGKSQQNSWTLALMLWCTRPAWHLFFFFW